MTKTMVGLWIALGLITFAIIAFLVWVVAGPTTSEKASTTPPAESVTIYALAFNGDFGNGGECVTALGDTLMTTNEYAILKTSRGTIVGYLTPAPIDGAVGCLYKTTFRDVPIEDETYVLTVPHSEPLTVSLDELREDKSYRMNP